MRPALPVWAEAGHVSARPLNGRPTHGRCADRAGRLEKGVFVCVRVRVRVRARVRVRVRVR
eukprot:5338638-Lingulodinium_polyedra.AAC.1